jgi:hypothetical protein
LRDMTQEGVRWKTVRLCTRGWIAGMTWIALAPARREEHTHDVQLLSKISGKINKKRGGRRVAAQPGMRALRDMTQGGVRRKTVRL